jgi:axial budding pattern protein 2
MPFCVVVASHELSAASSMPTVNITAGVPFKIDLNSPADFSGIFLDKKPIHAQNISYLNIDVSGYKSWLSYNPANRTLSGNPGSELAGQKLTLPVTLNTPFNQAIRTSVSLAIVPSYFTQGDFPTIYAAPGDNISFSLSRFFSNSSFEQGGDLDLSMIYEPTDVESFLSLSGGSMLEGTVPADFPTVHILVTFTAFSRVTRSTSHASLPIFITASQSQDRTPRGRWGGLSGNQHSRLVLALAIIFGILGGLCLVGGILAIIRKMARVEDTALTGEEGRNAWSDKDRKWYGLDGTPTRRNKWAGLSPKQSPLEEKIGLGLRRVTERSARNQAGSSSAQSSGVLSKREFFAKLKQTVRYVSDKYSPNRRPFGSGGLTPHTIERPIVVRTKTAPPTVESLPFERVVDAYTENGMTSKVGSINLSHSSSSSTAEYSIPQRRRDFGKPKGRTQVHFDAGTSNYLTRICNHSLSGGLGQSLRPGSRTSLRSNKSATVFSQDSPLLDVIGNVSPTSPAPATLRPRLVPFTSATRVPVPSSSPNSGENAAGFPTVNDIFAGGQRIASQKATIVRIPESSGGGNGVKKSGSGDELKAGLRYVQALGADNQPGAVASPGATSKLRSSFSSLESSNTGHNGLLGSPTEQRVLVTPGQKFRFFVRIPPVSIAARAQGVTTSTPVMLPREYNVKIISGQPLSQLHVDLNGIETRGTAEVTGESTREDIGVVSFGIYAGRNNEVCLAMVVIEVAETR